MSTLDSTGATVACVGNLTVDNLLFVERLPLVDQTVLVSDENVCLGGRGAVPAFILGAMGISVALCTVVGEGSSEAQIQQLKAAGVSVQSVTRDPHAIGLSKTIAVLGKEDETYIGFFLPSRSTFQVLPTHIETVRNARFVYFSTHDRFFNQQLIRTCDPLHQTIIHNISGRMMLDPDYKKDVLTRSTIILGTSAESQALPFDVSTSSLWDEYPRLECIMLTKGAEGVTVFQRDTLPLNIPAYRVPCTTPIGAGDAFAAGVIYGRIRNLSYEDSAKVGLALAAESIQATCTCPDAHSLLERVSHYAGFPILK